MTTGLARALTRARETRRLIGGRSLVRSAIEWRIRREYVVLTRDVRRPLPEVVAVPGLEHRAFHPEHLQALRSLDPTASATDVAWRLANRQRCVLSWLGAMAVHREWYTTDDRDVPFLGITLRALEGDILDCGIYTHPDFRGRGIAAAALAAILEEGRQQDRRRMIALVATLNHSSRRALAKVGFAPAGSIGFWPLAGKRRHFVTGDVVLTRSGFEVRRAG